MLKKKIIAILTLSVFLFNTFGQGLTLAVETMVVNNEKEKVVKKLDITEKIVNKVVKKIENKTKDTEIKKQLKEKQEEIKKVVAQAKKDIEKTNDVKKIKEKEEEVKKRVVLKLIDGITKKEDVKENVEEVVQTPKEYYEALRTMKKMFEQGNNYSLIVKTKYSYDKFVGLLKKFDKNIKPKKLFEGEKGYVYYELTIPKESIFAQEMLEDIEHFKMPKSFLGIKIVSPRIFKVEEDEADEKPDEVRGEKIKVEGLDKTWGVKSYGIEKYINKLKGKKKIKVAVIDTGIDPNHEDLKANIGKGYDFINNDNIPEDEQGHGTHVAGTIGAVYNHKGIVGVNPNVEIVPLKICDSNGFGYLPKKCVNKKAGKVLKRI